MRLAIHVVPIFMAAVLGACSAPAPKVSYQSAATVSSERTAIVAVRSGTVQGHTAPTVVATGGMFITVPSMRAPAWSNFNDQDASIFATSLEEELNRLGILKARRGAPGTTADFALRIHFDRTVKGPSNDYQLEVQLEIETPGNRVIKAYSVRSFDGEDAWTRFNVTPTTGKKMAAQKLLNAMIPDIEAAVRAEQAPQPTTMPTS